MERKRNMGLRFFPALLFGLAIAALMGLGTPLFGTLILAVILIVYVAGQYDVFRDGKRVAFEKSSLGKFKAQSNWDNVEEDHSAASACIQLASEARRNKVRFDGNSVAALQGARIRNGLMTANALKGLLLMLGLFGTVLGIMLAVRGFRLQPEVYNQTLSDLAANVHLMFVTTLGGILGYFGLSLTVLSAVREQNELIAEIEEFAQARLAPWVEGGTAQQWPEMLRLLEQISGNQKSANNAWGGFADRMENKWNQLADAWKKDGENLLTSLSGHSSKLVEQMGSRLDESLKARLESQNKSLESQKQGFVALSESLGNSTRDLMSKWEEIQKNQSDLIGEVKQSSEKMLSEQNELSGKLLQEFSQKQTEAADTIRSGQLDVVRQWEEQLRTQAERNEQAWNQGASKLEELSEKLSQAGQAGLSGLLEQLGATAGELSRSAESLAEKLEKTLVSAGKDSLESMSEQYRGSLEKLQQAAMESAERASEVDRRLEDVAAKVLQASGTFEQSSHLLHSNQAELQACVGMLHTGLSQVLESVQSQQGDKEGEEQLLQRLEKVLMQFHEKSNELLAENAVKTQEILMEVLAESRTTATGLEDGNA